MTYNRADPESELIDASTLLFQIRNKGIPHQIPDFFSFARISIFLTGTFWNIILYQE